MAIALHQIAEVVLYRKVEDILECQEQQEAKRKRKSRAKLEKQKVRFDTRLRNSTIYTVQVAEY